MEAEEFDALYTISFSRLVQQIYALIGDRDEAQDCVQEAFARAWSHRRDLDGCRHSKVSATLEDEADPTLGLVFKRRRHAFL